MDSPVYSEEEVDETTLSAFQQSVIKIRKTSANRLENVKLEGGAKRKLVTEILYNYCLVEDPSDLFEGFLRLLIFFGNSTKLFEGFVPPTIIHVFYHYINDLESIEDKNFILKNFNLFESDIYVNKFFFYLFFIII